MVDPYVVPQDVLELCRDVREIRDLLQAILNNQCLVAHRPIPTYEDLQRVDKHYGVSKEQMAAIVAEQSNVKPQ
jgi:hypothetical protein